MTPVETIVNSEAPPQPPAPARETPPVDAAALQQQIDDLKEQVAESNRTAAFWAEQARGFSQQRPVEPGEPEPEPEPEDEPDVLEAITANGVKGFDALAEKRGFIKRSEVQQMIASESTAARTQFSKEQELTARYPELNNRNSDFFKSTAGYYGQLVKSGTPAVIAMELASEKTELEFMRAGKLAPPDAKGDRERDRVARINAQSGDGGPRRPAADEADDQTLTDEQKRIVRGMGITEEAYLKRAKAGVRIGGKGPR